MEGPRGRGMGATAGEGGAKREMVGRRVEREELRETEWWEE
jgi:hypothetical protein